MPCMKDLTQYAPMNSNNWFNPCRQGDYESVLPNIIKKAQIDNTPFVDLKRNAFQFNIVSQHDNNQCQIILGTDRFSPLFHQIDFLISDYNYLLSGRLHKPIVVFENNLAFLHKVQLILQRGQIIGIEFGTKSANFIANFFLWTRKKKEYHLLNHFGMMYDVDPQQPMQQFYQPPQQILPTTFMPLTNQHPFFYQPTHQSFIPPIPPINWNNQNNNFLPTSFNFTPSLHLSQQATINSPNSLSISPTNLTLNSNKYLPNINNNNNNNSSTIDRNKSENNNSDKTPPKNETNLYSLNFITNQQTEDDKEEEEEDDEEMKPLIQILKENGYVPHAFAFTNCHVMNVSTFDTSILEQFIKHHLKVMDHVKNKYQND